MSKRLGVVALVLLIMAACAVVSAHEQNLSSADAGYLIEPVQDSDSDLISVQSISATIRQGLTNWHPKSVSSYITTLNVDLNWGNPSNSLRLKIYSPEGYTFGPYYDNFDGSVNGRININIINANGIARGTWRYEVYGDQVIGTQAYSI